MWELDHNEGWVLKNWMLSNCGAGEDLRVPWPANRSNQSILTEINPEYSLEGWCWSSNTLATWCKELTHWKRLILGNIEGRRLRGQEKTRGLDCITDSMDLCLSKLWEIVKDREAWHSAVHGLTKSLTQLGGWTINRVSRPKLTPPSESISSDCLTAEGRTEGMKAWLLSLTRTTLQCLSRARVLCGIG